MTRGEAGTLWVANWQHLFRIRTAQSGTPQIERALWVEGRVVDMLHQPADNSVWLASDHAFFQYRFDRVLMLQQSCSHPNQTRRILAFATPENDSGVARLSILSPQADAILTFSTPGIVLHNNTNSAESIDLNKQINLRVNGIPISANCLFWWKAKIN